MLMSPLRSCGVDERSPLLAQDTYRQASGHGFGHLFAL